ncbi:MAG: hypothetical protein K5657_07600, partial [Desulfovibrio sp.]|nr:hypothetical protein [Desulfovibrio sp.]
MSYSFAGLLAIIIHSIINSNILYKRTFDLLPEERMYRLFLFSVIVYHASDSLLGIFYEQKMFIPLFI